MSRAIIFGGRRSCTRSIQKPDRAVNPARLSSVASHSVSKRAHLAGRGRTTIKTLAVHDGSHRRIARQSLGIVHILVSGQASKHRLTATGPSAGGACSCRAANPGQCRPSQISQAENIVQLAIGQEPSV